MSLRIIPFSLDLGLSTLALLEMACSCLDAISFSIYLVILLLSGILSDRFFVFLLGECFHLFFVSSFLACLLGNSKAAKK